MIRFYPGRVDMGILWEGTIDMRMWNGGRALSLFALETVSPQHPGVNTHSIFMGKENALKVCTG